MAVVFLAAALLLVMVRHRWAPIAVMVVDVVALVGYVALSGARADPWAWPGLLVKAFQLALLAALALLLLRGRTTERAATG